MIHPTEHLAVEYLLHAGYGILYQNYRYKRAEVDIVASKGEWLVIVEVKSRKSDAHGFPEDFVDDKKMELLQLAAEELQDQLSWEGPIRFDIISFSGPKQRLEHFLDAF